MEREQDAWQQALAAQEKLSAFLEDPEVRLIDIGRVKNAEGKTVLGVRIFVSLAWMQSDPSQGTSFPSEVDSVPVQVLLGDYKPE